MVGQFGQILTGATVGFTVGFEVGAEVIYFFSFFFALFDFSYIQQIHYGKLQIEKLL